MTSPFSRLLDIAVRPNGLAFVLEFYCDESEQQKGSRAFSVAGYAFTPTKAAVFKRRWKRLFEDYGGRLTGGMADLHNRFGAFSGIRDEESDRLCRGAIQIINECVEFSVGFGCNLDEIAPLLPNEDLKGFDHAYSLLCHLVMLRACQMAESKKIFFFFEEWQETEGRTREHLNHLRKYAAITELENASGVNFVEWSTTVPLDASDLFAWEIMKNAHRVLARAKYRERLSFSALAKHDGFFVRYITGEPLRWAMMQYWLLGRLQAHEAREAITVKNALRAFLEQGA